MRYRYRILDTIGREHSGEADASDEQSLRDILTANGDLIVSLEQTSQNNFWRFERRSKFSYRATSDFASDLSALLKAGAPLRNALELLSQDKRGSSRLALIILRRLDEGIPMSKTLREIEGSTRILAEFSAAGEAGAGLERLLHDGGRFLAARAEAVQKIQNALAYPVFILILAMTALILMIVYVAPALAPSLTESQSGHFILILADIGTIIHEHGTIIAIGLAGLLAILLFISRLESTRLALERFIWKIPVIGGVVRDLDTGQSSQIIAALLKSGTSLEASLRFGGRISGSVLKRKYNNIAEKLRDGVPAAIAFETEKGLPLDLQRLARLGEATGALPLAVEQAGKVCHARALRQIEQFSSVAGPFLVIGMGGMIAALMLSVLGSLSSIGDGVL